MSQPAHDSPATRLRLAVDESEAWENVHSEGVSPVQEQCDAIADLFMNGGSLAPPDVAPVEISPPAPCSRVGPQAVHARVIHDQPTPASRPEAAPIEAMVLGHLPVLASAWGPQFARFVAMGQPPAPARPVGLVRFRAGYVSIELFGLPSNSGESPEPETDLNAAISRAARFAARWLVSVDATSEPDLTGLLRTRAISALTLLTGADEAATVACYRTMKSLLGPDAGLDGEPLPVRIAVMGSPDSTGAGDRLARAAETFLGFRPALVHAGGKIEPAPAHLLFRAHSDVGLKEVLSAIRRTNGPVLAPSPVATAIAEPELDHIPSPVAPAQPSTSLPDLSSLVSGLRPLSIRCPYARDAQFAVAPDGTLHALAWDDPSGLTAVAAAGAWATINSELVVTACPGVVAPSDRTVVQHVLTRDARRLRGLLDSSVKLHIVLTVPVSESLVAAELN